MQLCLISGSHSWRQRGGPIPRNTVTPQFTNLTAKFQRLGHSASYSQTTVARPPPSRSAHPRRDRVTPPTPWNPGWRAPWPG